MKPRDRAVESPEQASPAETNATAPKAPEAGLHLLPEWAEPGERERSRTAAILSVLFHVCALTILLLLPKEAFQPPPPEPVRHITTLIEPLTTLTQKAPNTAKVTKEFNAAEVTPRPRLQVPVTPPPMPRIAATRPVPLPPPPSPTRQATPLPEPPKLEAAAPAPVKPDLPPLPGTAAPPPPPQIQAEEKPKLVFENPGSQTRVSNGRGQVPIPGSSPVADAIRQAARGNSAGGLTVGDDADSAVGGFGGGVNLPAARASQASNIQLLSNPLGVDFKPYLVQVLGAVRRNWMNILPESVTKLGRRGKVAIQFSIARDGHVPKLVIADSSGADPLDRAAVAGISASVPFPPLPAEFKGDHIVLQFNFAYNMPR